MATLKAKLKRVIEPDAPFDNGADPLYYTFLDLTEPINGWTINNAVIMIDYTIMCFNDSVVSNSGAIRCTNVLTFDGVMVINKTNWGAVDQLTGSDTSNCRLWPCCTVGNMINFPLLYGANSLNRYVLTPNSPVGTSISPITKLQISIHNPGWMEYDFRYYITFDIMLFDNSM